MDKAVIFDMDGLMLDTKLTWKKAEQDLLSGFGKDYQVDIARKYQGMRISGVVEVMIKEYKLPIAHSEGERLLTEDLVKTYNHQDLALFEGCFDLVKNLYESSNFALAIASSSPKAVIITMGKKFNLEEYFSLLVSGEEVKNGKPAPDIYLHTARLLKRSPNDCVVLEDAPNGASAAKAAGMKVIAVYNKAFYKPGDFAGIADIVVGSLAQITPEMTSKLI